ncbi:hypothetical protein [Nocardioides humi]|uniref:ABC-2 type transport system permease protein n=1 Tax=Nocardioides humi TaxID=449461 RepID=A0ABN1ZW88_9ACTN|nr:hypothetical protein [Nocardioides humi]
MTGTLTRSALGQLARQEIANYARSKLFWFGTLLTAVVAVLGVLGRSDVRGRTALDGLAPGLTLGVLGIVVMAGLVRRSDRAAEAAGAVAVPERTRTLALAAATVVPLTVALGWWAAAAYGYLAYDRSADSTFEATPDALVLGVLFAQGVVAAVGGPLLGLVLARWLPQRWTPPIAAVAVVVVSLFMNGDQAWTTSWREVWLWTHFHGPIGTAVGSAPGDDPMRWGVLTGSVFWYVGYLLALCALGVLFAVFHDREQDRTRLTRAGLGVLGAAVLLCVLAVTGGEPDIVYNPLPSPEATG